MDNVVSTFPLLRLPRIALLNTLRTMNHLEICGISFLSRKTKNLVESLKLATWAFQVVVTNSFYVHLAFRNRSKLFFQLYQVQDNKPLQEVETPEYFYIHIENAKIRWTNLMSVRQLLDHLKLIFHGSISKLYFGLNCQRFNIESIKKASKTSKVSAF